MTTMALTDALATAQIRLRDERGAYALCMAEGHLNDAAAAKLAIERYEGVVARLEARIARG